MRNKILSTVFALTLMISTQVFAANETYRTTFDKVSPNRAVRVSVLVHEYDDYVAGGGFRHLKSSSVIINSELTNSVCEALYGRGAVSNGKAYNGLDLTSEPSFHIAGTNISENDEMHHKGFVVQGHPYVEFKHLVKIYGDAGVSQLPLIDQYVETRVLDIDPSEICYADPGRDGGI